MKTPEKILLDLLENSGAVHATIQKYPEFERSIIKAMEEYKDECLLYCGPADWDGVAAAKINELKIALQDAKNQHKEACYVIGKMSIENTNLKEENNRLVVVVSAQQKDIAELEGDERVGDEYQDLVRICTFLYKTDKEAIREMINESLGGDNFEKFKDHLGV